MRVLVVEQRGHIGGNAYDEPDGAGILYHLYGPHIYHTNNERVHAYLSRFTDWRDYEHRVLANVRGHFMPVPFNKRSCREAFGPERGEALIAKLIETYGDGARLTIHELRQSDDPDLAELAEYVFENIFLHYTMKQWDQRPEEVDPSVTARVPVLVSEDDRYFQDVHQGMPVDGYTPLFEAMLDHPGITVRLNTPASEVLALIDGQGRDAVSDEDADEPVRVEFEGRPFGGLVIFTGAIDELLGRRFGALPYRSLHFVHETLEQERFQPAGTVNYTASEDFTRITEWKLLTGQEVPGRTSIMREYPRAFVPGTGQTPYYAILSDENRTLHERYRSFVGKLPGFHLLGRLAEYRYYNMDAIVAQALGLADDLLGQGPESK